MSSSHESTPSHTSESSSAAEGHEHDHDLTRREVVIAAAGLAIVACSSDPAAATATDAALLEAKGPFPPWNDTTHNTFARSTPDGKTARYAAKIVGEKSLPTGTFKRYRMSKDGATTGAEAWARPETSRRMLFGGAEYTSETAKSLKLPDTATVTLETPVVVDLDSPVGVAQPITLKANVTLGSASSSASATGTYTVVAHDVTVPGPSGPIGGCTHIRVDGQVPLFFGTTSVNTKAQFWCSPGFGVVKAELDEPLSGLGMGVQGSRSSRDLSDGYASVEAMDTVGAGVSRFQLSTYEARGAFDADKETHAKMLVELRWADESLAKTDKRPYVEPDFGTMMGTFPATLTQANVSFLHPEENGKGFVYWYYYVDQAAKNESTNGIAYRAGVRYDSSFSAVRVTSRIVYKRMA